MLQLHLSAADLAGPWAYEDGAWRSGTSEITPFPHPSIETFAVATTKALLVVVRENPGRTAPMGESHSSSVDPDELLQQSIDWPLNVIAISIGTGDNRRDVNVKSSAHSTAPLFLAMADDRLLADWDVARLSSWLPLDIDFARTAYSLCHLGLPYSRRTTFRNVFQLTERSTARWCAVSGALEIGYPPPLLRSMPRRLTREADVVGAFTDLFGAVLRRSTGGAAAAVEVSGGLDSGTAALIAARVLGAERIRSFGLLLPGSQRASQSERRDHLTRLAGLTDHTVDSDGLGPFSRPDQEEIDPAIPWGEYYREAFLPLSLAIATSGCGIVIRGIGGDEISELLPEEAGERSAASEVVPDTAPAYFTDDAARALDALSDLDEAPFGAAPSSFYQAAAASAPVYMRRGIWPIYPYGTAEIVDFCRSLPVEWRRDRALQRTVLRAAGLPAEVARPRVPETFLPLRDQMFRGRAASHVRELFRAPLLAELGIIDADAIQRVFENAVSNEHSVERTRLLEAATIETVVRTWRGRSIPLGP